MDNVRHIAVCMLFRNNADYIRKYLRKALNKLESTYPSVTFSYFAFENDSIDDTIQSLEELAEGRCKIFSHKLVFDNNEFVGRAFSRVKRMETIRNMFLDHLKNEPEFVAADWCLFIDDDIYFEMDVLELLFSTVRPDDNGVSMMTCNTIETIWGNTLNALHTYNHYYDLFAFVDSKNRTSLDFCVLENCTNECCCKKRPSNVVIPKHDDVVDVRSAWGGFVLIRGSVFKHQQVSWAALQYDTESVCEHVYFCDMVRALSGRVVLCQPVTCYMHKNKFAKFVVSTTVDTEGFVDKIISNIQHILKLNTVERIYINITKDVVVPESVINMDDRVCINIVDKPLERMIGELGAINLIRQSGKTKWVFLCSMNYTYDLIKLQDAFLNNVYIHGTNRIWQYTRDNGKEGMFMSSIVLDMLEKVHGEQGLCNASCFLKICEKNDIRLFLI